MQPLSSHSGTISTGFHSQKLWGPLSPALEHWAGEPGVGLGLLIPPGVGGSSSAAELSLQIFNGDIEGVGPVHSASLPFLLVSR